jgi:hypothetical protein
MVLENESFAFGKHRQRTVKVCLDIAWHHHITHGTTRPTHKVMVVTSEIFGQFVSRPLIVGHDFCHDACPLEHRQVAIGGALRHITSCMKKFRNGQRMICTSECVDQLTTVTRESLADSS